VQCNIRICAGESNFVDALSRQTYDTNESPSTIELEVLHDNLTIRTLTAKLANHNNRCKVDESTIRALHIRLSEELIDSEEGDDDVDEIQDFDGERLDDGTQGEYEEDDEREPQEGGGQWRAISKTNVLSNENANLTPTMDKNR
jgi:hypothetical protein